MIGRQTGVTYIKSKLVELYIRRDDIEKRQEIGSRVFMREKTARSRISALEFELGDSDMNGEKDLGIGEWKGRDEGGIAWYGTGRSSSEGKGRRNVAGGKL